MPVPELAILTPTMNEPVQPGPIPVIGLVVWGLPPPVPTVTIQIDQQNPVTVPVQETLTFGVFSSAVTVPFGMGLHVITATAANASGTTSATVKVIVPPVGLWPPGRPINDVDSTSDSVGPCEFQDKLYLFWKANDPSNAIYYSASAGGVTWPAGQPINNTDSTSAAPVPCVFNNKLYLFWKANDPSNAIWYSASADGVAWPAGQRINRRSATSAAVAACVFDNKLYLFWKANDPSNAIWYSASADGVAWPAGEPINNTDSTSAAPTACVIYPPPTGQAQLFVSWTANAPSNAIYGSASADGVAWPAGQQINTPDSTSAAPAVHVGGRIAYAELFWKANDPSNMIYFSDSDAGSGWPAGQLINNGDSTSASPAGCYYNGSSYAFWKVNDPSNRIYYSASYIIS